MGSSLVWFRPQGWGLSLSHPLPSSPTLAHPRFISSKPRHCCGNVLSPISTVPPKPPPDPSRFTDRRLLSSAWEPLYVCYLRSTCPSQAPSAARLEQYVGSPGGSGVKNPPANAGHSAGDASPTPGSGRPPDKKMATQSALLPGKSHGRRGLGGYGPRGPKGGRHNSVTKQQ